MVTENLDTKSDTVSNAISLEFHHVGLLVESIEFTLQTYIPLFANDIAPEIIKVESQQVKVCFLKTGKESFLELVEPINELSPVSKLLQKRITYYHIGYKVSEIVSTVTNLEKNQFKALSFFNSEAFEGKKCVFLFSPQGHLIELIEK